MSEEHYPAKSTGNEDIVALDFSKMVTSMMSDDLLRYIQQKRIQGESLEEISGNYFDNELANSLYPKGRTARTLCRKCNTFLGRYDEAYKKFFDNDGDPRVIKGYTPTTKLKIIKAIFAKFLSVPECKDLNFDFIDFLKDEKDKDYCGKWKLYCLKRDDSTDFLGMRSLDTGEIEYDEGIIFELSDEKFIYHLMDFDPHISKKSMNMMDILNKQYKLVNGYDVGGGYHADLMVQKVLSNYMNI